MIPLVAVLVASAIASTPPRARSVSEVTEFDATLKVEQLRFTCDSRDVTLWGVETARIPIALRATVATAIPGPAEPDVTFRRTLSAASFAIGERRDVCAPVLLGRTLAWPREGTTVRLQDLDADADAVWSSVGARIGADALPWTRVWTAPTLPALDDAGLLALQRSFAVPGGLAALAPDETSADSSSFWAVLAFLDECADPRGAAIEPAEGGAGVRRVRIHARPDGAPLLRALWRRAWDRDHGVRDVGEVRGKLEYRQRSELSLGAAADESSQTHLRNQGRSTLRGDLEFTTRNDSWPAKWTCHLEVELDWRTIVDWKRAD